ncbi:MAG: thiamine phosphate synthase [Acidobacteriota bacterium]
MQPIRYYITNRLLLPPHSAGGTSYAALLDSIQRNARDGVDWIQIREKDLSAYELLQLVAAAKQRTHACSTKIIVNTRFDVALAAGADGVHLPEGSPDPNRWRPMLPDGFLIGVSCHSVEDVHSARQADADYALFGPVFAPVSKTSDLSPRGLEQLHLAAISTNIPVLALGGVTGGNTQSCLEAGAAGVAGISLFQP